MSRRPSEVVQREKKFFAELDRLCDLRDSRPEDASILQTQIDNLCIEFGTQPGGPKYKRFPIADAAEQSIDGGTK